MSVHPDYRQFLADKIVVAAPAGFEVGPDDMHPSLTPVQRVAIPWMLRGGRRALFKGFGLGKTRDQLWALHLILRRFGGRALIVAPLGVRVEFFREAAALSRLGIDMLDVDEEARIRELIAAGTWPQGWDGDEPTADTPMDAVLRDGTVQPLLFGATA